MPMIKTLSETHDLSRMLNEELRRLMNNARETKWRKDNSKAIESYNRLAEKNGIFGEEFRNW